MLVAALCVGATTIPAAQQPGRVAPSATLSGPRLRAEWPRYDAGAAQTYATTSAALSGGKNHTFVFSTLALVIIGVLILVLVL